MEYTFDLIRNRQIGRQPVIRRVASPHFASQRIQAAANDRNAIVSSAGKGSRISILLDHVFGG